MCGAHCVSWPIASYLLSGQINNRQTLSQKEDWHSWKILNYDGAFAMRTLTLQMNNYIVMSYRDVIVITKFAITKYAIRRASKAKSIVMY